VGKELGQIESRTFSVLFAEIARGGEKLFFLLSKTCNYIYRMIDGNSKIIDIHY